MPTASSDRKAAATQKARTLPEFFRNYQERFGANAEVAALPDSATRRSVISSIAPSADATALLPWRERLQAWIVSPDGRACGVSLLVHGTLLLCLSLMALRHGGGGGSSGVSLGQGDSEGGGSGFENVLGEGIESSTGSVEIESVPAMAAAYADAAPQAIRSEIDLEATVANLDPLTPGVANPGDLIKEFDEGSGGGRGRGAGSGVGNGIGNLTEGFAKPGSGRAVRKGKFTAWTVPSDPKPMQNYLIVIEVAWPKTTDKKLIRSRRNDVTGTVVGSDSYFQIIEQSGRFIPKSNQIVVPVPGAEQNVRDVIRVRSKQLEESQELTITF